MTEGRNGGGTQVLSPIRFIVFVCGVLCFAFKIYTTATGLNAPKHDKRQSTKQIAISSGKKVETPVVSPRARFDFPNPSFPA
jgi:hypothetical protein